MAQTITLGGKRYQAITNSTIEHDIWLQDHVRRAGLDPFSMQDGESAEQYAQRLLLTIIQSGRAHLLLAGCLQPEGADAADWTPEAAEAVANDLKRLTAPADKEAFNHLVVTMLMGFFVNGLASCVTSPKYGASPTRTDDTDGASGDPAAAGATAEPAITATSTP